MMSKTLRHFFRWCGSISCVLCTLFLVQAGRGTLELHIVKLLRQTNYKPDDGRFRPKRVVYCWCYLSVKYIFSHSCVLTIFYFISYYCCTQRRCPNLKLHAIVFNTLAVQKCQQHCFHFGSARLGLQCEWSLARPGSVRLGQIPLGSAVPSFLLLLCSMSLYPSQCHILRYPQCTLLPSRWTITLNINKMLVINSSSRATMQ
jgi:hypothetical protein